MSLLSYHLTFVKPAEIDLSERKFLFSFPERKGLLIDSIANFGLIEPPLLLPSGNSYIVVCGEGRVKACMDLSFEKIPALLIRGEVDERRLLLISLESNRLRGLNLVEKALFIDRACRFFTREELLKLLPRLGLSESRHWIFYFRKLLSLEEPFLIRLAEGRLNPKLVESLSDLRISEREEFLELLERVHLTHSEQREVLEMLLDNWRRSNFSEFIPGVIRDVLRIESKDERRREFFNVLRGLRYPKALPYLRRAELIRERFRKEGIEIAFSPYLEKKSISISFSIESEGDLEKKLKSLREKSKLLFSAFEGDSPFEESPH